MADRYEERETDFYRRPRREREYGELDVDITRSRYPEPRAQRAETAVRERDTVVSDRRTERGPRQPDFLREDYGKSNAGPLVLREERREDDVYSRAPTRRRSQETVRSRAPPERLEKEEIIIRERDRERGPPYPRDFDEVDRKEEIVIRERERARSRGPPPREREDEEIDIKIRRGEEPRPPPPRGEAPRNEYRERDVEEIRFRRGGGDRAAPPPPRTEVDREEIRITGRRGSPPARSERGRDFREEIDIDIRERSTPVPRQRSQSRGALVARKDEEWVVRRRRERSPSPLPPPRDYEKEEIIIRRKERTPSPEPVREPTPEPPSPPPLKPIYEPPIVREVITHHRHIDHGVVRARSPTPPPPPAPPSPPREENLEIEIRRQGTRNGKFYDEDIIFEKDFGERKTREDTRELSRRRSVSASTRRRSPSPIRRRFEDDIADEADYYNRKVSSRAYPGEAYNGATKDWALVDIPPGTERVRMDGVGGGAQEITWQRYNGARRGKFITGDRAYEQDWGNGSGGYRSPEPRERSTEEEIDIRIKRGGEEPRAPPPPPPPAPEIRETRITERRIVEETNRGKTRDKMWTEVTKDLVIKEAIDEMGYEYEETDRFFYVIEYLQYVSPSPKPPKRAGTLDCY